MKYQIKLISSENIETINIDNVIDEKHLVYIDTYGAHNELTLLEKGINIIRTCDSHRTHLYLKNGEKSFVEIETDEGNIYFDVKVLAFRINNDIITLVYSINNETKSIEIKTWE